MPGDLATPDVTAMVAWLREQIDEDERVAEALLNATRIFDKTPNFYGCGGPAADVYWQRFDPVRALHEVEAKRRIIAEHTPPSPHGICQCLADWPCATLLSLLPIYADRPGFREEWRP